MVGVDGNHRFAFRRDAEKPDRLPVAQDRASLAAACLKLQEEWRGNALQQESQGGTAKVGFREYFDGYGHRVGCLMLECSRSRGLSPHRRDRTGFACLPACGLARV